jgi:hypothetical protein
MPVAPQCLCAVLEVEALAATQERADFILAQQNVRGFLNIRYIHLALVNPGKHRLAYRALRRLGVIDQLRART